VGFFIDIFLVIVIGSARTQHHVFKVIIIV